jgi:hypothetical protein
MPTASHALPRIALIFVALLLTGCPSPDAKQKALQASMSALNTARDTFVAWDEHHQHSLVAKAKTFDEGKQSLESYRDQRSKVVQGFVVAYSAIAAAALEDKLEALVEAAKAVQELYGLIKSLTGDPVEEESAEEEKRQ